MKFLMIFLYLARTRLTVSSKKSSVELHLYAFIRRGAGGIGFGGMTSKHSSLYARQISKHSRINSAYKINKLSLNSDYKKLQN